MSTPQPRRRGTLPGGPSTPGSSQTVYVSTPEKKYNPVGKPVYGGLVDGIEEGRMVAFVGGKPGPNYAGVTPSGPESSACYRFPPGSSAKREYVNTPVTLKWKKGDKDYSLEMLLKAAESQHKDNGNDSVGAYVEMPGTGNMELLSKAYRSVTVDHVKSTSEEARDSIWDQHAKNSDREAKRNFRALLDTTIREDVDERAEDDDTCVTYVMRLVSMVTSTSLTVFESKIEELKKLSPLQYAGQNIVEYTTAALRICKLLDANGQWRWTLLIPILEALTKVTVVIFKQHFMNLVVSATEAIGGINHLQPDEASKEMRKLGLHYQDILGKAESMYHNLPWPPRDNPTKGATLAEPAINFGDTSPPLASLKPEDIEKFVLAVLEKKQPAKATKWRENYAGDKITKDGKEWVWCKQCRGGKGLYTDSHTTDTHEAGKGRSKRTTLPDPNSANTASTTGGSANIASDGEGIDVDWFFEQE